MHNDIATRASVLTLISVGKPASEISEILSIPRTTIRRIYSRATERGFDPNLRPLKICDTYVADAPRSGRPKKQTPETEEKVLTKIRLDPSGREISCVDIARELSSEGNSISSSTVWRIVKKSGLRKAKPSRKSGLTKEMRIERLPGNAEEIIGPEGGHENREGQYKENDS